ncbi:MAG: heavy-metal-associated domain-containing protein [bacterium]|jgi:mercuric ion binding protein
MKSKIAFSSFLLMFVFSTAVFAQKTKNEDIKVWGNCGSCKKTIEAAAVNAGATSASWSEASKILTVSYNKKKTDQTKIQEAVAASGYDTQDFTAPAEAYKKLPGCCQYDRKAASNLDGAEAKACCSKEGGDKKSCDKEGSDKEKSCCKQ